MMMMLMHTEPAISKRRPPEARNLALNCPGAVQGAKDCKWRGIVPAIGT
jgi:hypothetical protein